MPALLLKDRRLVIRDRRLLTDEGGAPCCCDVTRDPLVSGRCCRFSSQRCEEFYYEGPPPKPPWVNHYFLFDYTMPHIRVVFDEPAVPGNTATWTGEASGTLRAQVAPAGFDCLGEWATNPLHIRLTSIAPTPSGYDGIWMTINVQHYSVSRGIQLRDPYGLGPLAITAGASQFRGGAFIYRVNLTVEASHAPFIAVSVGRYRGFIHTNTSEGIGGSAVFWNEVSRPLSASGSTTVPTNLVPGSTCVPGIGETVTTFRAALTRPSMFIESDLTIGWEWTRHIRECGGDSTAPLPTTCERCGGELTHVSHCKAICKRCGLTSGGCG